LEVKDMSIETSEQESYNQARKKVCEIIDDEREEIIQT